MDEKRYLTQLFHGMSIQGPNFSTTSLFTLHLMSKNNYPGNQFEIICYLGKKVIDFDKILQTCCKSLRASFKLCI